MTINLKMCPRMRAFDPERFLGADRCIWRVIILLSLDHLGTLARSLTTSQYWERRLPGQLLHNNISHGIRPELGIPHSDSPVVLVHGVTSPYLRGIGENENNR